MKISIVTISFNQGDFLKRCIDSVLSQECGDLEYIVVDPGSTDGSRSIIETYGKRLTTILKPDDGPSDGLNKGFEIATGDIFGFINADDYLLPGSLSSISNYFKEASLDHFVSGYGFEEWSTGARKLIKPTQMNKINLLYGACIIFQQGTFFPSNIFRKVGGFNTNNKTCWDAELYVNFICQGFSHKLINKPMAVFSIHPSSISGSGRLNTQYQVDLKRIFHSSTGRERNKADIGLSYLLRFKKQLTKFFVNL